jgi:D-glycero-alpha-D-manno-heptose 1-phosphate guanylyltransferase
LREELQLQSNKGRFHQLVTETEISKIPALILAGGLGTRLRNTFNGGPKSMAPIGGRPFLDYLLLQLSHAGFRRVVLCLGYGRTQIEDWAKDGRAWGLEIAYSVEMKRLGTGGAIKQAESLLDTDDFLLLNGDSFLVIDLQQLVRAHLRAAPWATLALTRVDDPVRYGTVILGTDSQILAFVEKDSAPDTQSRSNMINAGVYVLSRRVLDLIPESATVSLEREVFPRLLAKGVRGFPTNGYFVDIGVPRDFERAQSELPRHA